MTVSHDYSRLKYFRLTGQARMNSREIYKNDLKQILRYRPFSKRFAIQVPLHLMKNF